MNFSIIYLNSSTELRSRLLKKNYVIKIIDTESAKLADSLKATGVLRTKN